MKLGTFSIDYIQILGDATSSREQKGSNKGAKLRAEPFCYGHFCTVADGFGEL